MYLGLAAHGVSYEIVILVKINCQTILLTCRVPPHLSPKATKADLSLSNPRVLNSSGLVNADKSKCAPVCVMAPTWEEMLHFLSQHLPEERISQSWLITMIFHKKYKNTRIQWGRICIPIWELRIMIACYLRKKMVRGSQSDNFMYFWNLPKY